MYIIENIWENVYQIVNRVSLECLLRGEFSLFIFYNILIFKK